jgi:heat shock protein HslJ
MRGWTNVFLVVSLVAGIGAADAQVFGRHRRPEPVAARPAGNEKAFPFNVTWVLQAIDEKPLVGVDAPSFSIDTTLRARGFGGCNTFSMAYYPMKQQTLASGAIAMTHRTCSPAAAALERTVLVAMHSQPKWDVRSDGDLVLTVGRTSLRFRRGV